MRKMDSMEVAVHVSGQDQHHRHWKYRELDAGKDVQSTHLECIL